MSIANVQITSAIIAQNCLYASGYQLENARAFGVPVVALNAFPDDKPSEVDAVRRIAREAGAADMAVSTMRWRQRSMTLTSG